MVRYLALLNFTDQGILEMEQSVARASDFRSMVEAAGGNVSQIYWALGEIDGVVVFEVPDEQTGASLMLQLSNRGFVRSRTLRVYDEGEFHQILSKTAQR